MKKLFTYIFDELYLELVPALALALYGACDLALDLGSYLLTRTPLPFNFLALLFRAGLGISLAGLVLYILIRRLYKRRFKATLLLRALGRCGRYDRWLTLAVALLCGLGIISLAGYHLMNISDMQITVLLLAPALCLLPLALMDQASLLGSRAQAVHAGQGGDEASAPALAPSFQKSWAALGDLESGLQQAMEEAIRAERMKTELIANVSHDIRTPLTAIVNFSGLLNKPGITPEEQAQYREALERNALRLKTMTTDLIEASKTSTGNVTLEWAAIDMVELAAQAYGGLDDAFAARNLTFVFNHGNAALVWGDGAKLWRVVENLLTNAAKYSLPGSRVYCDIQAEQGRVCLMLRNVSDEPLNMDAAELMARFVRGDRSRHSEGSGLGLYIARNLVELMGGILTLSIQADLFTVKVVLPQATGEEEKAPPSPTNADAPPGMQGKAATPG